MLTPTCLSRSKHHQEVWIDEVFAARQTMVVSYFGMRTTEVITQPNTIFDARDLIGTDLKVVVRLGA